MNGILVNLMLAVFWLVLGCGLLGDEVVNEQRRFRLPLGGINPGWLAVLFAAFNFYRVWSIWSYQKRRRLERAEDDALRRKWDRRTEERREEPPNPDFQFDKPPAAQTDRPPTS